MFSQLTFFNKISGKEIKEAVFTLMLRVISNYVASLSSWLSNKGKYTFSALNFFKGLMDLYRFSIFTFLSISINRNNFIPVFGIYYIKFHKETRSGRDVGNWENQRLVRSRIRDFCNWNDEKYIHGIDSSCFHGISVWNKWRRPS